MVMNYLKSLNNMGTNDFRKYNLDVKLKTNKK